MKTGVHIAGVVLVGGKGKRMGCDKLSLVIRGHRVLQYVVNELAQVCEEIIFAGRSGGPRITCRKPTNWIPDIIPERGPLAGAVSAMKHSRALWFLIIPCDMPFLNAAVFRRYLAEKETASVIVSPFRGFPVLIHHSVLPVLEKALKMESLCFFDVIFQASSVRMLSREKLADLGNLDVIFCNINTPEDLSFAEQVFTSVWM